MSLFPSDDPVLKDAIEKYIEETNALIFKRQFLKEPGQFVTPEPTPEQKRREGDAKAIDRALNLGSSKSWLTKLHDRADEPR